MTHPAPIDTSAINTILSDLDSTREAREDLYKQFHREPELSLQEESTAQRIADQLEDAGIEFTRVGNTGIVAVIENGEGPVVAMRGDIDALPMKEDSGKDYASTHTQVDKDSGEETPVAHSCGHDFHIMSLLTSLKFYNAHKDAWSGTYVGVFQPAEEIAAGAKDMLNNGIAEVMPTPDVYLGQHVLSSQPGGTVGTRPGPVFSAASSIRIEITGKGSHGSMPEKSVDPVVTAANVIVRLQQIVSRSIAPAASAVVTVGSVQSGTKSNIIPATATLLVNTRTYDEDVQKTVHEEIENVVRKECEMAHCPKEPSFEYYDIYPLTDNDADATEAVHAAFDEHFGEDSLVIDPLPASEDFSYIPDELGVPYVYWGLGGFADMDNAPANHNPGFAPDLQPTLDRGAEAAVVAAGAWLATSK